MDEAEEDINVQNINSLFLYDLDKMNKVQDDEDRKDILGTIQSGLNSTRYDEDPIVIMYRPQVSELVDNAYNEMWNNPDKQVIDKFTEQINSLRAQLNPRNNQSQELVDDNEEEEPYTYVKYTVGKLSSEEKNKLQDVVTFINNIEREIDVNLKPEHTIIGLNNIFDKAMSLLKMYSLECDTSLQIIDGKLKQLQYYAPFITNNEEFYKMVYLKQIQPDKAAMKVNNNETNVSVGEIKCVKLKDEFEKYFDECNKVVSVIITGVKNFDVQFSTNITQYALTLAKIHPNKNLIKLLASFEEYLYKGLVFDDKNNLKENDVKTLIEPLIVGTTQLSLCLEDDDNFKKYKLFVTLQKIITNVLDKSRLTKINRHLTVNFGTSFKTVTASQKYVKDQLTTFYKNILACMSREKNENDPSNSLIIKNFQPSKKITPFFIHFKLWFLKNYTQPNKNTLSRVASIKDDLDEPKKVYSNFETIIQTFRSVSDGLAGYQHAIDSLINTYNNNPLTLVTNIFNILSAGKNNDETLQPKLINIQEKLNYTQVGQHLDCADLAHDITIYKPLLIDMNNKDLFTASGQAVQHKLRKYREDILSNIVNICKNNNVALPDLSDRVLTKMQTHAYFYKFLVDNPTRGWLYKESGRRPDLFAFFKYYNQLNEEDSEAFTNMCMNYANETPDNTQIDEIISQITENMLLKDKKNELKDINKQGQSIYVPLWCISGFDGGGNVMTKASPSFVVFENVYGFYKYYVFSNWAKNTNQTDTNDIGHLVVVTNQDKPLNILAVFCFVGKVTLNALIDYANKTWNGLCIPRRGGGEDEGGNVITWTGSIKDFMGKYQISLPNETFKMTRGEDSIWMNALHTQLSSTVNIINATTHYFDKTLDDNQQQLLFFLNKTIGDKIFSVYPSELKVITTVDSLVPQSVLLHGLSGKIDCIQEVWRKGRGGSTSVSPGVFVVDYNVIAKSVLYKMVCYGFVYKYITNNKYTKVLVKYGRLRDSVVPSTNKQIIPVISQVGNQFSVANLFKIIQTYTGIDINEKNLIRISNAVDFLCASYKQARDGSLYDNCMTYLSDTEHELMQLRVLEYLDVFFANIPLSSKSLETKHVNNIYSLPDLEQLFAFNMDAQGTANQTYVDFYEIETVFPLAYDNTFFIYHFAGLNPDITSEPFTNPTDNNPRTYITMGEEKITFWFFIPSTKESHEASKRFNDIVVEELTGVKIVVESSSSIKDNKQNKMALYRIDVEITIELLMQVFEKIQNQPDKKLIPLKSTVATMIIEFFDEQKEELITKYGKYGFADYSDDFNNTLEHIRSAIIVDTPEKCYKMEVVEGDTKRDRKRVAHKKQTKKLRRKKHRTVNKRRARK